MRERGFYEYVGRTMSQKSKNTFETTAAVGGRGVRGAKQKAHEHEIGAQHCPSG